MGRLFKYLPYVRINTYIARTTRDNNAEVLLRRRFEVALFNAAVPRQTISEEYESIMRTNTYNNWVYLATMIDVLLWRLRFSIRNVLQVKTCCYLSTEGKERGYYWCLAAVSRDQTIAWRKTQVTTAEFRSGGGAKFEPVTSGWWRACDLPITQPRPVYKVTVETRVHHKQISICGEKLKLRELYFFQGTSDLCAIKWL